MKQLCILFAFIFLGSLTSCVCECVGPSHTGNGDKVCRTEYENAYGQGSWANYEAGQKAAYGWVCK